MRDITPVDWLLANSLIVTTAAFAFATSRFAPEFFYRLSQEDHWVEWSTVWAFLLAAAAFATAARYRARSRAGRPWFFVCLAAFCLAVAMEEMSWGQRLLSYRPPAYFLEGNFQQELNLHNVVDASLRKWALQAVILGYGVLLPVLGLVPVLGGLQKSLGITPPPRQLIPAFIATAATYHFYALGFTGEWVEFMLGLGMLFAGISHAGDLRARVSDTGVARWARLYAGSALTTLALGAGTLWLTAFVHAGSPQIVAEARAEVAALARDFEHERVRTRCGVHKRVYTFQREYGQTYLRQGAFSSLQGSTTDHDRRRFFLDPWNMPYWVRHACKSGRSKEIVYVYSFGPNRRRDSTAWEMKADDVTQRVMPRAQN